MDQADTLEAFIEKLHKEGVEAGLQDAEQLRAAAAAESAGRIDEARETGRRLIAEAEAQAGAILAEAQSELALAVRDAQLELRVRIERMLTSLLEEGLERDFEDPELLARLLRDVVSAYARDDAADGRQTIEVKVRADLLQRLSAAVPGMLGRALADGMGLDLRDGLGSAGFEYRVRGAVVEVTPESVAEKLTQLVSTQLRTVLRAAADERRVTVDV
jgi:vacuolar-type H+-ATPase subunit H